MKKRNAAQELNFQTPTNKISASVRQSPIAEKIRTCSSLLIAIKRSALAPEADANVSADIHKVVEHCHHLYCIVCEVRNDKLLLLL